MLRTLIIAVALPVLVAGVACSGDGGSGTCIDTTSQKCSGVLVPNLCPGPATEECCVTDFGNCPGGVCQMKNIPCKGHYVAGECPGPAGVECCTTGGGGGINRTEIMKRAQTWVDAQIPYCQCSGGPPTECCGVCPYCSDYRCDCSGYVSYTWNLGKGYTTSTLPEVRSLDSLIMGLLFYCGGKQTYGR
jgi:hypothetical protein